ncbi:MAG: hypothetical protein ABI396_05170 [Ktedonobacteraceae bacterium]
MSNIDPFDPLIQLEVTKVLLKTSQEKVTQLEQVIGEANRNLGERDRDLRRITDKHSDLRIKWEILQRDYKHTQDTLTTITQKKTKNRMNAEVSNSEMP